MNLHSLMPVILVSVLSLLSSCGGRSNSSKATDVPNASSSSSSSSSSSGQGLLGGGIQGKALNLTNTVTTLAGVTPGADGVGPLARFSSPDGSIIVGGNLFLADSGNNTIRKIVIATGEVTTLAGVAGAYSSNTDGTGAAARFGNPHGITTDGTHLFVADNNNHTIRKIVIDTGMVTTLAGMAGVSGGDDGTGADARFQYPYGITSDGSNLYVTDSENSTIRKIVIATGAVTTLAGKALERGSNNGRGTEARFDAPAGITTDGMNLFVVDSGNHVVRKVVIATAEVTTLAGTPNLFYGSSEIGGPPGKTQRSSGGITADGVNVFVADYYSNVIRKINKATGEVTIFAGTEGFNDSIDGSSTDAGFDGPLGIATDGINLFVTDNNTVRKIVMATGTVTTLAGSAIRSDGMSATASFDRPRDITTDGTNLFVSDAYTVSKVLIATGEVSTLAGSAGTTTSQDGTGTAASFNWPRGLTTDGTNLFVVDYGGGTIRKIVIATGAVTTLAGGSSSMQDGIGTAAGFVFPEIITTDGTNLFVGGGPRNPRIRKIVIATREVTSLKTGGFSYSDGTDDRGEFYGLTGMATDGTHLFVTDTHTIRKIVIATGVVTNLAGSAFTLSSNDGIGAAAGFGFIAGITTDGTHLFVTDLHYHNIRKIVIATGAVTTIAGSEMGLSGSNDGVGPDATFTTPAGITTDGTSLFVTDLWGGTIRKIE